MRSTTASATLAFMLWTTAHAFMGIHQFNPFSPTVVLHSEPVKAATTAKFPSTTAKFPSSGMPPPVADTPSKKAETPSTEAESLLEEAQAPVADVTETPPPETPPPPSPHFAKAVAPQPQASAPPQPQASVSAPAEPQTSVSVPPTEEMSSVLPVEENPNEEPILAAKKVKNLPLPGVPFSYGSDKIFSWIEGGKKKSTVGRVDPMHDAFTPYFTDDPVIPDEAAKKALPTAKAASTAKTPPRGRAAFATETPSTEAESLLQEAQAPPAEVAPPKSETVVPQTQAPSPTEKVSSAPSMEEKPIEDPILAAKKAKSLPLPGIPFSYGSDVVFSWIEGGKKKSTVGRVDPMHDTFTPYFTDA